MQTSLQDLLPLEERKAIQQLTDSRAFSPCSELLFFALLTATYGVRHGVTVTSPPIYWRYTMLQQCN